MNVSPGPHPNPDDQREVRFSTYSRSRPEAYSESVRYELAVQGPDGQTVQIGSSISRGRKVRLHGNVTCIAAEGSMAKIAGILRNGDSFNLFVEDVGEGHGATDVIFFDSMADTPDCDFDQPEDDDLEALARGNAQVYDAQS